MKTYLIKQPSGELSWVPLRSPVWSHFTFFDNCHFLLFNQSTNLSKIKISRISWLEGRRQAPCTVIRGRRICETVSADEWMVLSWALKKHCPITRDPAWHIAHTPCMAWWWLWRCCTCHRGEICAKWVVEWWWQSWTVASPVLSWWSDGPPLSVPSSPYYRVFHLLVHLGWVDFNLNSPAAPATSATFPSAQAELGRPWNIIIQVDPTHVHDPMWHPVQGDSYGFLLPNWDSFVSLTASVFLSPRIDGVIHSVDKKGGRQTDTSLYLCQPLWSRRATFSCKKTLQYCRNCRTTPRKWVREISVMH